MSKQWLRDAGGFLHDLYDVWVFNRRGKSRRYRGVYRSYQAAQAAMPQGRLQGFNHNTVADFFAETHFVFNPSDYPVLFWLAQLLKTAHTIFDFGGGVGQCYFLYKRYLHTPGDVEWIVCEVESQALRGAELAKEAGASSLRFTTRVEEAAGCDVFFTAGVLHYLEPDLSALLAGLPQLPKHVLVNRVPLYEGEAYYTVQRGEHSYLVHKVMNLDAFIRGMEELGYEKVDQWYLHRSIRIPLHPERSVRYFWGFYFRRKEAL